MQANKSRSGDLGGDGFGFGDLGHTNAASTVWKIIKTPDSVRRPDDPDRPGDIELTHYTVWWPGARQPRKCSTHGRRGRSLIIGFRGLS
jgi:hypothetical protein